MRLLGKERWLLIPLVLLSMAMVAVTPIEIFSPKVNPLDIPLYLSGNFGEPRTAHFHAGIDIRTNQKEGLTVYSVADGWISRVKISPFGYGKAVYISHPNGYTTVYAHLNSLSGPFATEVKKKQFEQESFEQDLYFEKNRFPVKCGEPIGLSGNSGGSGGPHLHFEVRDAAERALNPQLYGFLLNDVTKPTISGLRMYRWDAQRFNASSVNIPILGSTGTYATRDEVIKTNVRKVAFSANIWDIMDANSSRVGVYQLKLLYDNELVYEFKMDKISFDQGRYWGAHMDYALKQKSNENYHRLHQLPADELLAVVHSKKNGVIHLKDDAVHTVQIIARDVQGNESILSLQIQFDAMAGLFPDFVTEFSQEFDPFTENNYQSDGIRLSFPKGVLFDTLLFKHESDSSNSASIYSRIHRIHQDNTYLFSHYQVSIAAPKLSSDLYSKAVIVYKDYDGSISCIGGEYKNGFVSGKARSFGDFYVRIDNKAPVISPLNISSGKKMTSFKSIRIKIEDDLSGIDRYSGSIDGKWILMDYDAKNDLLEGPLEELSAGNHRFSLSVTDKKGNSKVYETEFIY